MRQTVPFGVALIAAAAASASGQTVIASFSFQDLAASYTTNAIPSTGGQFQANAADLGVLKTFGGVTAFTGSAPGQAEFEPGFVSAANPADFNLNLTVSSITATTAVGLGSFVITDADGDQMLGDIDGLFIRGSSGRTFFNGNLSNVRFSAGAVSFNGTQFGAFSTDLGTPPTWEGAIVQLMIRPATVSFFGDSFSNLPSQASAEIVPAPGMLALLGLAGAVAGGRRRR